MSYLVETHFHTSETSRCGQVRAAEGIRLYASHGYHAVVVTDHFHTSFFDDCAESSWSEQVDQYLEGYNLAFEAGEALGIRVILGLEFTLPGTRDDILIYGVDRELLLRHPRMYRLGPSGLSRLAQQEGFLLIQAHPFRPYISRVYDEMVEGLEVHNGNPRHQSDNRKASLHADERGWICLSGSDFHQKQDVARGGVRLPVLPEDSFQLARMLRQNPTPELILS